MPRPRVRVVGQAATALLLDTFQAQVEAEMPAASQVFDRPVNWATTRLPGGAGWQRALDVRLKTTNAGDQFWSRLRAKLATLRAGGLVAGVVLYHQCSHDDPVVVNCRDAPASALQEAVL